MKLSEAEISEIAQLLRDADFDDLELEWGDIYFRVARRTALAGSDGFQRPAPSVYNPTEPAIRTFEATQPIEAMPAAANHAVPAPAPQGVFEVASPLMGTVYRAPQPGDPAFIEVGAHVQKGDTLCLVEVMKVFTALKAEYAGTIERILINDGDLIDYNQIIMWIRPT
jgi:acetyl-CoA carboxylase biotin carboxyl carrier protein